MALDKMLQFRMGDWSASFDSMTKAPGTVYVTKNEKAMYVDVDENTRIRLGETIQLDSKEQLGAPPYSTEAYYYFVKENALMKYAPKFDADGNKLEGQYEWKQINSLSNLDVELGALTSRVDTAETAIANLETTVNGTADAEGLVAKVATLTGNAETTGSVLHAEASAAAALAQANKGVTDAATAQAKADANAGLISGIDSRLEGVEGSVATLGGEANVPGSVKEAKAAADAAKAQADKGVADAATAKAAADAAQGTADGAAASASANAADILTLGNRVSANEGAITTINTNAEALTTRVTTAEGKITTLEGKMDVLKGGSDVDGSVANAKKAGTDAQATANKNKEDLATLTGTVGGLTTAVGDINNELDLLEPRVKANEDDIAAIEGKLGSSSDANNKATAFTRIEQLEEAIGGGEGTGKNILGRLDDVEETVSSHTEAIAGLEGSVDANAKAISAVDTALGKKGVASEDTAFGLIAKNAAAIGTNTSDIATLKTNVSTNTDDIATNTGDISTLKQTVAAIPDTYVNKTAYQKDQKDLAKEMADQHALIETKIKAANGMTYKGTITESLDELPVPGVKEVRIGDTYVVANDEGLIADTVYYSGDMLIARGDEDPETGLLINNDNFGWDHVKTGYELNHDPKIDIVATSVTENEETVSAAKINLHRFYEEENVSSLGEFTIKGGENVKVSVDAATRMITIGMAWDTF